MSYHLAGPACLGSHQLICYRCEIKGHLDSSAMLRNLGSTPQGVRATEGSSVGEIDAPICVLKKKSEGSEMDERSQRQEKRKTRGDTCTWTWNPCLHTCVCTHTQTHTPPPVLQASISLRAQVVCSAGGRAKPPDTPPRGHQVSGPAPTEAAVFMK